MGSYTVPKRIERNGRLIAFAGQVMTEEEAKTLGILEEAAPKRELTIEQRISRAKNKTELKSIAEELSADIAGLTNDKAKEALIAAAKALAASKDSGGQDADSSSSGDQESGSAGAGSDSDNSGQESGEE